MDMLEAAHARPEFTERQDWIYICFDGDLDAGKIVTPGTFTHRDGWGGTMAPGGRPYGIEGRPIHEVLAEAYKAGFRLVSVTARPTRSLLRREPRRVTYFYERSAG